MTEIVKEIGLEVTPFPPDTVNATRKKLVRDIEDALRNAGYGEDLADGNITIRLKQNIGIEILVVYAAIRLTEHVLEKGVMAVINAVVIPGLREHYGIKENPYVPPHSADKDSTDKPEVKALEDETDVDGTESEVLSGS
jgi:hypothetical protein